MIHVQFQLLMLYSCIRSHNIHHKIHFFLYKIQTSRKNSNRVIYPHWRRQLLKQFYEKLIFKGRFKRLIFKGYSLKLLFSLFISNVFFFIMAKLNDLIKKKMKHICSVDS